MLLGLAVVGCGGGSGSGGAGAIGATAAPIGSATAAGSVAVPGFVPAGTQLPATLFDLPAGYLAAGGDPVNAPTRLESDVFTDRHPALVPATLRVVSWNVFKGDDALAIERSLTTMPELASADFVVLQEVPRGDPLSVPSGINLARHLAQVLRMDYVLAGQWDWTLVRGAAGEHGTAILSKYPLGNATIVRHTATRDWYGAEGRVGGFMSLGADALVGGQRLRLYSTHLEVRDPGGGRARQARELRLDADRADRPSRQIAGGDFNTWLHSPTTLVPLGAEPLVHEFFAAGWRDGLLGYNGPTHLAVGGLFRQRLDWIFYRGVTGTPGTAARQARGSDHLPIYFDFVP